jgi:hypothetical protein
MDDDALLGTTEQQQSVGVRRAVNVGRGMDDDARLQQTIIVNYYKLSFMHSSH